MKTTIRKVIFCCWSCHFIVRYSTGTRREFKYSNTPNTVFDFIENKEAKRTYHGTPGDSEPRLIYKEV